MSQILVVREGRKVQATLESCESCGSEHLPPVPCGLTFAERIKGLRFGSDWMPARTAAHPRIDREAVAEVFGPDSRERMLDETRGLGPVRTDSNGRPWVYDDPNTGEMRPMENSDVIGGYLRGADPED